MDTAEAQGLPLLSQLFNGGLRTDEGGDEGMEKVISGREVCQLLVLQISLPSACCVGILVVQVGANVGECTSE